jgi:hypothetical protein
MTNPHSPRCLARPPLPPPSGLSSAMERAPLTEPGDVLLQTTSAYEVSGLKPTCYTSMPAGSRDPARDKRPGSPLTGGVS